MLLLVSEIASRNKKQNKKESYSSLFCFVKCFLILLYKLSNARSYYLILISESCVLSFCPKYTCIYRTTIRCNIRNMISIFIYVFISYVAASGKNFKSICSVVFVDIENFIFPDVTGIYFFDDVSKTVFEYPNSGCIFVGIDECATINDEVGYTEYYDREYKHSNDNSYK